MAFSGCGGVHFVVERFNGFEIPQNADRRRYWDSGEETFGQYDRHSLPVDGSLVSGEIQKGTNIQHFLTHFSRKPMPNTIEQTEKSFRRGVEWLLKSMESPNLTVALGQLPEVTELYSSCVIWVILCFALCSVPFNGCSSRFKSALVILSRNLDGSIFCTSLRRC